VLAIVTMLEVVVVKERIMLDDYLTDMIRLIQLSEEIKKGLREHPVPNNQNVIFLLMRSSFRSLGKVK
jgi:hypothetical protein